MPRQNHAPAFHIDVDITSLGGLGDGIGSHNGKPVFVPKSLPGDRLQVRIVHENRDGLQGQIERVITPSPDRNIPPCRYFETCGGCSLQQLSPESYRDFKTRVLQQAAQHAGLENAAVETHFIHHASRRRVEFKIDHLSQAARLAYHAPRSHTPVPIDSCLILDPALDAMIAPINDALTEWPFTSNLFALSLTMADSGIDMLLTFRGSIPPMPNMTEWLTRLSLQRISVRIKDSAPGLLCETSPVTMQIGGYAIPLPPDAFLQATSEGQQLLTNAALEVCGKDKKILDLFCGIGTYSFAAASNSQVHAIELDAAMTAAMKNSIKQQAIANLTCQQRDLFQAPLTPQELSAYDAVILNPPRLGAKAQCEALADSAIARIAMISCNPATFARDVNILTNKGFKAKAVHGVDQFVFSPHLEITCLLERG